MKRKRVEFMVSLVPPDGATPSMLREYIEDAVGTWCKSFKPPGADPEDPEGNPLFDLDRDTIRVSRLSRRPAPSR